MTSEIRLLIADDHPIFRRGLRAVIETDAGLKVVAEADNGAKAVELVQELRPDIALLDVDMPVMDGLQAARELQALGLDVGVIVLTIHKTEKYFNAALDAGVKGYVLKDIAMSEIVDCIRAVAGGKRYVSAQLTTYLMERTERAAGLVRGKPTIADLTTAERRVLKAIAEEKTSREIAAVLYISVRTVEHHRANICEKLDLHGSNALIRFALAHKPELL